MKEKNGVFNCSYCYFSFNRQNNKFWQQGLVCHSKKVKYKSTNSGEKVLFITFTMDWEASDKQNQMYLFLFKNNQVLSLSSIAYFFYFATTYHF